MPTRFNLNSLESLNDEERLLIERMGIGTIAELLAFQPVLDARRVLSASQDSRMFEDVKSLLRSPQKHADPAAFLSEEPGELKSVSEAIRSILQRLELETIKDLALWSAFAEAEGIVAGTGSEASTIGQDPHASECLIPRCREFTTDTKSFVSFFRDLDISDNRIENPTIRTPVDFLFRFNEGDCKSIYLGYAASYRQTWTHVGIHLGEPLGSLPLLMAQDSREAKQDWRRINQAARTDALRVSETLTSALRHQRAIDEVSRATAEEHQFGATSSVAANAATAGSFVAAGAIIGAVGGGVSGALTGLVAGNVANAAAGAPTLAGAAIGSAVGGAAGAAAGSLVYSGATTLGFVEAEASGDRSVAASSGQRIQERSLQNASSLRSMWAQIATQTTENEIQNIRTERVRNHNKIHALNAMYFEVLNRYSVVQSLHGADPILFLPFKPLRFAREDIRIYWWILRQTIKDPATVAALDEYFSAPSPSGRPDLNLDDLPPAADIETSFIEVRLDFDGSSLETLLRNAFMLAFSIVAPVTTLATLLDYFLERIQRTSFRVEVLSLEGTLELIQTDLGNHGEYIGTFQSPPTTSRRISTITGIRIHNENPSLGFEPFNWKFELNEVALEAATVELRMSNRRVLLAAEPELGSVEDRRRIGGSSIIVNANSSVDVPWNIARVLADRYSGITEQQDARDAVLSDRARIDALLNNLMGFYKSNAYGFTRLILTQLEQEQLSCTLDQVELNGVPLRDIAHTIPIGISGMHLLLSLKAGASNPSTAPVNGSSLKNLTGLLATATNALSSKTPTSAAVADVAQRIDNVAKTLTSDATSSGTLANLRDLLSNVAVAIGALETFAKQLQNFEEKKDPQPSAQDALAAVEAAEAALNKVLSETESSESKPAVPKISDYIAQLDEETRELRKSALATDDVSLPSPAIFLEPILSTAKGAELLDITRNANYPLPSAPEIWPTDPNVNRSRTVVPEPTIPDAVLKQQQGATYALPTSLQATLTEAGKLSTQPIVDSNAASLQSTLASLSGLATELAKASTSLTGDAQKAVLEQAEAIAEHIGKVVNSGLTGSEASNADTGGTTAAPAPPTPPITADDKGKAINETKRTIEGAVGESVKDILGVPKRTPDR